MEQDKNKTTLLSSLNKDINNTVQTMGISKQPLILAKMSNCCFFTNCHFSLAQFPPLSRQQLRYQITEVPLLLSTT